MSAPRWLQVLIVPLAAFVALRIVAVNLAQAWSVDAADAALAKDARQPAALVTAAMEALAEDPARAERLARDAIAASPVDGRGYGVLARALDAQRGDADAAYAIAMRRAPRDAPTRVAYVGWLLQHERLAAAVDHVLVLAWIRPEHVHKVYADLLRLVEEPAARDALIARLLDGASPKTRKGFFTFAANGAPPGPLVDAMFAAFAASPGGASADERRAYGARLVREKRWFEAWAVRRAGLPADRQSRIENLVDGGFDAPIENTSFGWELSEAKGAETRVVDGRLRVDFFGARVPYAHVRQYLLLAPGAYRFSGLVGTAALVTPRGLRWSIECAGTSAAPIAQAGPWRGDQAWGPFDLGFEVPASGCDGQLLRLETAGRAPFEWEIAGRIEFDDLRIVRAR